MDSGPSATAPPQPGAERKRRRVVLKASNLLFSCTTVTTPTTKTQFTLRTDLAVRATPDGDEAFLLLFEEVYHFRSADHARECYIDLVQSAALYATGGTDQLNVERLLHLGGTREARVLKKHQYEEHNIFVT